MRDKVNIFEEINKMKSLIRTKAGTVISEQETDLDKDIEAFKDEIVNNAGLLNNVDEKKLVDILKKYATDKNTFQNFQNKFQEKHKYNPTSIMAKSLDYSNDVAEINDLNSALSKIGLRYTNSGGIAKFEELSAVRQRNINANYCRVKDDKIVFPGSAYNGSLWSSYVSANKVTPEEITAAKATCPQVVVPDVSSPAETPKQTGPTPSQRFATTATSLGIQNPKMDVATLQTILNTLNQGGSGLTESKNLVNEELNKMKYMLGYQRGRVISEQDAAQPQQAATQQAQPVATQQAQPAATQQATPAATQQAQPAATQQATPKDLIRQIQTVLKTKYNANLGKFGIKGDGIDEKWGNLTQTALDNALKSIADVKQKRATETQQTNTQDTAIQQAAETGRMAIPQTNNLPTQPGIQQRPQVAGVKTK